MPEEIDELAKLRKSDIEKRLGESGQITVSTTDFKEDPNELPEGILKDLTELGYEFQMVPIQKTKVKGKEYTPSKIVIGYTKKPSSSQ